MGYDVYGVGNALVDIQARVEEELIRQLSLDKGIMKLVDNEAQKQVLDQLSGLSLHTCAGGSAANTIVGLAELGGTAAFAGKIADDDIGRFFLNDMLSLGVDYRTSPVTDGQTGTCAVLITPDAQRTMLTNLAVSSTLAPEDIDESMVAQSKYVYVEGYLLTNPLTKHAAYHAMAIAKRKGVKVAFSASDPFLIHMLRAEIWELIEGPVDLFFCNEQEAKSLTGKEDPIACASLIHEHAENVALTLGPNGSILMHGGKTIPIEGVAVNAIDTTGAGDMYAGAMLYGVTSGMSWHQAGHLASHAAARVVAQMGARLEEKFTPQEVTALIANIP
jgi:sugar/nucleoside kinase (ribokinase family)